MALCVCGQMQVNAATTDEGTIEMVSSGINEDMLRQIEPTYLKEVAVPSAWSSNWFVGVSGGTSAFVGKPHGKGNLFDRMKPSLAIEAGKWFTPEIGGRFSFQGFQFKDACKNVRDYKMVHADFLWNVTNSFVKDHATTQRWGFIPYAGCGIIHNEDNGKSPFVINYGVIGQYRLTKRLAVNMELGGATTFRDFDGVGASNKFGDNLFILSAGLTFNIGKVGWKKVVDAAPYINQNKWLADYINDLVATRGMAGMLNTIWLILCAMCFGSCMVASGMLHAITHMLLKSIHSTISLVCSTVASGVLLNLVMGDQFLSIIMNASIYKDEYAERGYRPELLSRSTEDSATVTSVLVPWTACGMTQSTVLGIPTLIYLPFCFFNIISPLMSCLVAILGFVPKPQSKESKASVAEESDIH